MKLVVVDLSGAAHEVPARKNWTVMEIIRDSPVFMRAECGGAMACATCHVHVDPDWTDKVGPPSADESATLEGGFDVQPNSRLSCQITFTEALDGLKVTMTKDSGS